MDDKPDANAVIFREPTGFRAVNIKGYCGSNPHKRLHNIAGWLYLEAEAKDKNHQEHFYK